MFAGFVPIGSAFVDDFLALDANNVPNDGTGSPTFTVYGPSGAMAGGTGTAAKTDATTGLYRYTVTPSAPNGYVSGQVYRVVLLYVVSAVTYAVIKSFQVT